MKPFTITTLFWCLVTANAASSGSDSTSTSRISLPTIFKPPQVFRNANLVHIVSLDKNYAKELINVQIENIDKAPQDEYYVPFTSEQIARIGGFEVKDKKNQDAGAISAGVVEYDSYSDMQFYRIKLPAPLNPGAQQTLAISYYILKAYSPLPVAIKQEDKQYLVHKFNAYAPSAYRTMKQKTEVKTTGAIQDYTIIDGESNPTNSGNKLVYGPFPEVDAGAVQPAKIRFEFTKPVLHISSLKRNIEVSHWGGNVAFEEHYDLFHRGANLSSQFNRVKWAQSAYYSPMTYALKELKFPLRAGSVDAYYTDVIGNVSTSHFRTNQREAMLEVKPRYPVFGGWKYPFTIGWNSDAKNFLRKLSGDGYVLNIPFLEGPKQTEGVEYETVQVRVVLPEGSTNLRFYTSIPASSIGDYSIGVHYTYLDTLGRTVLTINARNVVDEFRDRELIVTYDYSFMASIRKPMIVFTSMLGLFVVMRIVGSLEVKITSNK